MPYYHPCPHCGAHLDPGETCDCKDAQMGHVTDMVEALSPEKKQEVITFAQALMAKQKAAPGATNTRDGKAENMNSSASILPEDKEDCQV